MNTNIKMKYAYNINQYFVGPLRTRITSASLLGMLIIKSLIKSWAIASHSDWDDPRLFTLTALRRRGFPSEAINNFCAQLGVTGAQSTVDPTMLEAYVRDYLNNTAPRRMVVLEPLKISIENFPHNEPVTIDVPNYPNKPELGSHTVKFDRTIYIERSDFMELGDKSYRRLTKTQSVGIRHAGYILEVVEVKKQGPEVTEVVCKCLEVSKASKPKAFIHWVSCPQEIEVRLYTSLFKHKNPEDQNEVPGGFISDCNFDSLHILKSYADMSLKNTSCFDKFQFERNGFFSVGPDSCNDKLVFNRTVSLKEDVGK